uniref:Uncharacterized protein n=1 Tax=Glossina morsitans morsitans TaxID=37546 RepID=A0A1B0GBN3_GLOMM
MATLFDGLPLPGVTILHKVYVHNGEGEEKIRTEVGELSDGMTSSDEKSVVAKGGQKVGPLKRGGAKRVRSPSDVSDRDTGVLSRSDSLPTVADSRQGKKRKAQTSSVAASVASALVLGAAASAASRPVRAWRSGTLLQGRWVK